MPVSESWGIRRILPFVICRFDAVVVLCVGEMVEFVGR